MSCASYGNKLATEWKCECGKVLKTKFSMQRHQNTVCKLSSSSSSSNASSGKQPQQKPKQAPLRSKYSKCRLSSTIRKTYELSNAKRSARKNLAAAHNIFKQNDAQTFDRSHEWVEKASDSGPTNAYAKEPANDRSLSQSNSKPLNICNGCHSTNTSNAVTFNSRVGSPSITYRNIATQTELVPLTFQISICGEHHSFKFIE